MKLYTLAEAADLPKPPWVIPGWFRERSLTMLSAPGGVGKSNFAQALAISAAAGKAFLHEDPPERPMRVVYIGVDAASWDYAHVARRVTVGLGLTYNDLDPERDDFAGGIWYRFDPLLLEDGHFEEIMNTTAFPSGALADLVVVDCLRAIHDHDENKAELMAPVMRFFRKWAERNCAILLLHHSKKPGEFTSSVGWDSARGSGAIHNSVDTHIVLEPAKVKIPHPRKKIITAHWAKGRGGDDTSGLRYRMAWNQEQMTFTKVVRGRPIKRKPLNDEPRLYPPRRNVNPLEDS